ncbi:MAG: J domain-containing protein [Bacteroidetes bacterium]|nr:J domain-containing protein [Bacteroidota bacterium]
MSFHNYYKLLNISEKAGPKEIKDAYHKIALKYHPDKMPDEEGAEEYFKIITKGYNLLSNPKEKVKYDILLYAILEEEKKNSLEERKYGKRTSLSVDEIKKKLENIQLTKNIEYIRLFKRREKSLSHKIRYPILILAALSGYLYVFNNWFVNEAGMDYFYLILGFFSFGIAVFFFCNHLYIQLRARNIAGKSLKYPFERTSITIFIFVILIAPMSIIGFNTYKKEYHLNQYGVMIEPLNISFSNDRINYSYLANNEVIFKSTSEYPPDKIVYYITHKKPIIRVSKYNPKISRLEFIDLAPSKHPKI